MGEGFAERLGVAAGQPREDLALGLARQIGAGPARRQKKLRNACVSLFGHSLIRRPLGANYVKGWPAYASPITEYP